jgi:hypothetical protein
VDQQAVDGLERDLRQVLVRAVDRVARLEADDALPAALGEQRTASRRVERELGNAGSGRSNTVTCPRGSAASARRAARRRVRVVGRAEAALGLDALVVLVDLLDLERRRAGARFVRERNDVALRRRVDGEADRQRPRQPAGEVHVLDDASVVLAVP